MKLRTVIASVLACCGLVAVEAHAQTWTPLNNQPPVSVGAMLLLTDGRVLVHEEPNCGGNGCVGDDYTAWYTLTPDITGSYINGTWTKVASLPDGYAPLDFASAVLADGQVVVQGGEYQCPSGNCTSAWQSLGAIYDPKVNTWTATTPPIPNNDKSFGDAQSVVLPNNTWMVAACCAAYDGDTAYPQYFYFNEGSLNFTAKGSSTAGKADEFDEEGWNLLPNGNVLTVDAYLGSYTPTGTNSETYNESTNKWTTAGSTVVQLWDSCNGENSASYEVGPAVLMPNGTVFATGASSCAAGNTAIYNVSSGTWTAGPSFPKDSSGNLVAVDDGPASIETNGNVIVMASPSLSEFYPPASFWEWNGSTLTSYPAPSNAVNDGSDAGKLLVLPTGQIMFTDWSNTVEILTTAGTYQAAWQPTVTSTVPHLTAGDTYSIQGTQFNGLSQGAAYGDDFQDNTNYPLVRLVNNESGDVFYAKTHGHSTMAVATGSEAVSTNFDVPPGMETGPCTLYVVANGIPSAGVDCFVGQFASVTVLSDNVSSNFVQYGQSVTFTAQVQEQAGVTPTGTITFAANGTAISGCAAVALNSSGIAQCKTNALPAGNNSVTAAYGGDANYQESTGEMGLVVEQAAALTTPSGGSTFTGPNVTFSWNAVSGATDYIFRLGTSPNGNNVYASGEVTATSVNPKYLPTNGETVYGTLVTVFGPSQVSKTYTFTATAAAALASPNGGSTLTGPSVTFSWSASTGATDYSFRLGTSPGANNVYASGLTTATSVNPKYLPTNGETLYGTLSTYYGSTSVATAYTFTATAQAALTSPTDGSTLSGPSVTFSWTAATGATGYAFRLGTTPGANNVYGSGVTTATSVNPKYLPTNGETLYGTLYTYYGSAQETTAYTFTAQ